MTDQEQVVDLYRRENEAMVNKDIVTLNEILAPSMNLQHMTGYVQPKFEWIDQIQNGDMKYFSSKEENIKDIVITGNHASLIGQNRVQASVWGSAVATWPLQMKMEFVRDNGQWKIANQVASTY
ncbi:MAG: nuclear transport factor 2 family protein [Limosilactobacillus sp.]